MTFEEARQWCNMGAKCYRKSWQGGWIEYGQHQESQTLFYIWPECPSGPLRVTFTGTLRGRPHDTLADDWEIKK